MSLRPAGWISTSKVEAIAVELLLLLAPDHLQVLGGEEALPGPQRRQPVDAEHPQQRGIGEQHLTVAAVLPDADRVLCHQRLVALIAVGARALRPSRAADQDQRQRDDGRQQQHGGDQLRRRQSIVEPAGRFGHRRREVVGQPAAAAGRADRCAPARSRPAAAACARADSAARSRSPSTARPDGRTPPTTPSRTRSREGSAPSARPRTMIGTSRSWTPAASSSVSITSVEGLVRPISRRTRA